MARYIELRNEKRELMVVDTKSIPHKVICTCTGYDAPFNCEFIIEALEAFNSALYDKFLVGVSSDG